MRVALGFRPHSGWAAAVVVGGDPASPVVLERRRVALADLPPPVQPYHEAAGLDPGEAAALVEQATTTAYEAAGTELPALVDRLSAAGHDVVGAGVAAGPGSVREDLPLARILAAHGMLHAAEGELYRDVLVDAAAGLGLPVTLLPPKEVPGLARQVLGVDDAGARVVLTELGRPHGPPWTRDHKDATVAALLALEAGGPARVLSRRRSADPSPVTGSGRAPATPAPAPRTPRP